MIIALANYSHCSPLKDVDDYYEGLASIQTKFIKTILLFD